MVGKKNDIESINTIRKGRGRVHEPPTAVMWWNRACCCTCSGSERQPEGAGAPPWRL
jgi:hypothetical protein